MVLRHKSAQISRGGSHFGGGKGDRSEPTTLRQLPGGVSTPSTTPGLHQGKPLQASDAAQNHRAAATGCVDRWARPGAGGASDRLKERAQSLAADQHDKAVAVAEHAYEETKDAAGTSDHQRHDGNPPENRLGNAAQPWRARRRKGLG